MSRCTIRQIFTVLIYAGVFVFLYPYFTGHRGHAVFFLAAGIGLATLCGILRCTFEEGDCTEREFHESKPCPESTATPPSTSQPQAPSHP